MKKQEILKVLKQCRGYIHGSNEFGITNAIYITPAQQLRNQADELEQKDSFVNELNQTIQILEEEINQQL